MNLPLRASLNSIPRRRMYYGYVMSKALNLLGDKNFRLWISSKFLAKTRKLMSSINEDTSYGGNLDSHAAHIPYIKLSMKHFPIISKLYAAALQIVNYKKHIYKMNIPSGLNH